MKLHNTNLHDIEILATASLPGDPPTLKRTAVPGGWLYTEFLYVDSDGVIKIVTHTTTFVPDVRADRAEDVVRSLLADLTGRRGFRQTWEGLDLDVCAEMKETWTRIVRENA